MIQPSVVRNMTDRHLYKVVAVNEDGTIWGKRHGKLTVLWRGRSGNPVWDLADNTPRWCWQELTDEGYHFR